MGASVAVGASALSALVRCSRGGAEANVNSSGASKAAPANVASAEPEPAMRGQMVMLKSKEDMAQLNALTTQTRYENW